MECGLGMCMDSYLDYVDWNDVWKAKRERSSLSKKGIRTTTRWEKREQAERYAREADEDYQKRVDEELVLLPITPESRILDIGSGPGTLSIPMAKIAHDVTAVEPAAGMVSVMTERAEETGLGNITFIQKTWEEVDPEGDLDGPYDLVIASFSLVMDDISRAIDKMNAVCRGSVYLFTFVDGPLWEQVALDIWMDLHGTPYYPGPKADVLWNALYQSGIYANILMRPLEKAYKFRDLDEATAFFGKRFGIKTPQQENILHGCLSEMNMATDGSFILRRNSTYATLWWDQSG
jgi:SAM-dependent methyltransferase